MLATLTQERFSREGSLFEPKWDGERCLAFRRGDLVALLWRNRTRPNEKYPEIILSLHQQRMKVEYPSATLIRRLPVCHEKQGHPHGFIFSFR